MRPWLYLLGGLCVWAAHFFILYGIASIWPGTRLAPALVIGATVLCLVAAAALLLLARRARPADELERWMSDVAAVGAAISLVAILWQGLPALEALI